jgi:Domain of unknown function (DUF4411)
MLLMEVGDASWDFEAYIRHYNRMQTAYHAHISEYSHGGSKRTIGLTDMTIVALAKTLDLPVVSMEASVRHQSPDKRRIPDICHAEGLVHYTFNEFLKKEGIGA